MTLFSDTPQASLSPIEQLKQRLRTIHEAGFQNARYLQEYWCPPTVALLLFQEGQEMRPARIQHTPGYEPLQCFSNALLNWLKAPATSLPYVGLAVYGNHQPTQQNEIWWPHCWVMCDDGTLLDSAELSPTPHYVGVPLGSALFRAVEGGPIEHPIFTVLAKRADLWHLCR